MHFRLPHHSGCQAISLFEILAVVAILGILSAVAIPAYDRFLERSKETVAEEIVEYLNNGLKKYLQMESTDIQSVPASADSSAEEIDVLRALQWEDSSETFTAAPYVRDDYNPSASSSTEDYRAIWNGTFFELAVPGETGAGLKIELNGADYGQTVTFADDFVPLADY